MTQRVVNFDFPKDGYLVLSLIELEREFAEGIRRILEFEEQRT